MEALTRPQEIPPATEDLRGPEMSARLVGAIVRQLEQEHGAPLLAVACAEAGLSRDYLNDPHNWVSNLFHRRLVGVLGRQLFGIERPPPHDHPFWQAWRRAGQQGYTPDQLGPYWPLLRTLGTPRAVLRVLPRQVTRFNRTLQGRVVAEGPGWTVVEVGLAQNSPEWTQVAGNCWARIGILEGLPTLWGLPMARVEHTACMYDLRAPAPACTYRVSYGVLGTEVVRPLLPVVGLAAALWGMAALGWLAPSALAVGGVALMVELGRRVRSQQRELTAARDLERLLDQADLRYARLWSEGQELRRAYLANRKLSGYLPGTLVERIMRDPEVEMQLGGNRTYGAVLFADLVAFTPRCARQSPEQVLNDLNRYFGTVDAVIEQFGGVIDKRMGDGLMVVFTPQQGESYPQTGERAVRCGLAMLRAMPGLNRALAEASTAPWPRPAPSPWPCAWGSPPAGSCRATWAPARTWSTRSSASR